MVVASVTMTLYKTYKKINNEYKNNFILKGILRRKLKFKSVSGSSCNNLCRSGQYRKIK